MLQCYDTFLTSHNLTCTKVKTHPNPLITQRIRGYSWKSSILQERDGAENLALPLLILKPMTVVYSPLAHKWSIIVCLERLSSKNRITQEPVQQFPSKINLLVATSHKCPSEVICKNFDMEIIKTPQYLKTSLTTPKVKLILILKMIRTQRSFCKIRYYCLFKNTFQH